MDDKKDIKGEFIVLYRFHLPYRPASLYRFWKWIREWPYIKFIDFCLIIY